MKEIVDTESGEIMSAESMGLTIMRPPDIVLKEARIASKALQDVISKKLKPVIFNGEQYLEMEDWALVARFYGVNAKIITTNIIQMGGVTGFEAFADAVDSNGRIVSSASAMCLNDEDKWSKRTKYQWKKIDGQNIREAVGEETVPMFQLRSMAQTRACAKVLRQLFSWVVVLAGYNPTPVEERDDITPANTDIDNMDLKEMTARFLSKCAGCQGDIPKDSKIIYDSKRKKAYHPGCLPKAAAKAEATATAPAATKAEPNGK